MYDLTINIRIIETRRYEDSKETFDFDVAATAAGGYS
jgi:hypothetical protein